MTSPDQDDALTVMTLNIWGDHLWEERKHALVDWFTEIRPDVVALQEATRSPELCEATWLAEQTGMDAVYAAAYVRSGRSDFGNAVLSRWPIVDSRSLQLTLAGSNIEPRGALTVDVRVRNRLVSVTSTHLSYRFDEGWVREAQVRQLADFVGTGSGDFPLDCLWRLQRPPGIYRGAIHRRPARIGRSQSSPVRRLRGDPSWRAWLHLEQHQPVHRAGPDTGSAHRLHLRRHAHR